MDDLCIREDYQKDISQTVVATLKTLVANHNEIFGCDNNATTSICKDLADKIKELCRQIETQSTNEKEDFVSNLEEVIKECFALSKELNMTYNMNTPDNRPLSEMLSSFKIDLRKFSGIKNERVNRYKALRDEESILCEELRKNPLEESNGVPTVDAIDKLEHYVETLNEIKQTIICKIQDCREKVKWIMQKIEVRPSTPLELFCFDDSSNVSYSKDTLDNLKQLIETLEQRQKCMIKEADSLRESLHTIWNRIEEPILTREKILSECSGYTKGTIQRLKAELNRCEEKKQKNMLRYINKIKDELQEYWLRCRYSDEQKKLCRPFFSTHCTEDVADLLEIELNEIRQFYSTYQEIYHQFDIRKELWDKFEQLEETSKCADRLFKNRGGALLKEENERKRIQKQLPIVEKKLKALLEDFECEKNREFTIFGTSVRDLIAITWNTWHKKKDHAKNARKQANAKNITQSRLGSATPNRLRPATSPGRHANVSNKLSKVEGTFNSTGSSTALSSVKSKSIRAVRVKTPVARGRNFATPATVISSHHDAPSTPSANVSTASTYSLFQEHLEGRIEPQKTPGYSSHTPSNVLRPRNTPMPPHSSPKNRFTPYSKTRSGSKHSALQHKSPFKVGISSKIPTLNVPLISPRTTPHLRTPRRKLPIII